MKDKDKSSRKDLDEIFLRGWLGDEEKAIEQILSIVNEEHEGKQVRDEIKNELKKIIRKSENKYNEYVDEIFKHGIMNMAGSLLRIIFELQFQQLLQRYALISLTAGEPNSRERWEYFVKLANENFEKDMDYLISLWKKDTKESDKEDK